MEEIDSIIEPNLRKWSKNRISRVALSALRGAVCEILYDREIPESVSINEAVEIVKKFSGKEEASFVNGVLGSIVKTLSVQTDGEH